MEPKVGGKDRPGPNQPELSSPCCGKSHTSRQMCTCGCGQPLSSNHQLTLFVLRSLRWDTSQMQSEGPQGPPQWATESSPQNFPIRPKPVPPGRRPGSLTFTRSQEAPPRLRNRGLAEHEFPAPHPRTRGTELFSRPWAGASWKQNPVAERDLTG